MREKKLLKHRSVIALCKAPFAHKFSQTISSVRTFKERTKLYLNKEILLSKKTTWQAVKGLNSTYVYFLSSMNSSMNLLWSDEKPPMEIREKGLMNKFQLKTNLCKDLNKNMNNLKFKKYNSSKM